MKTRRQMLAATLGTVLTLGVTSCTTTSSGKKAKSDGFLGDYSSLTKGGDDQAQKRYVNPTANFRKYNKVMIDPVEIWAQKKFKLEKLPTDEVNSLINYLDAAVRRELGKDYQVVTSPGADVMRLRLAITEAKGSNVTMNTVSSVIPIGLAISAEKSRHRHARSRWRSGDRDGAARL